MFIVGIDITKRNHAVRIITSEDESVVKPFPSVIIVPVTICCWSAFGNLPPAKAISLL